MKKILIVIDDIPDEEIDEVLDDVYEYSDRMADYGYNTYVNVLQIEEIGEENG